MNRTLFALLTCAAAGHAQVLTPGRIVGFTSQNGSSPSSSVSGQALCARPVSCPSPLPTPPADWAGGAAYNAINGSLWHTQGTRMAENDVRTCALLCSVPAHLTLGATSLASGLALSEARRELYQLETMPGAAAITTFDIRLCPPTVVATCRFPLPSNSLLAGGLAYDRRNEVLAVALSQFSAVVPNNVVMFIRRADPLCAAVVCRLPAPACGTGRLGAITGLGIDCCDNLLYATDGRQTGVYRYDLANCSATPVGCCVLNHPTGETWFGIDVEPVHPRDVGQSCLDATCRQCTAMALVADGDPVIGNTAFAVRVIDGQAGALSIAFMGVGGCHVPGLPVLCGNFHPSIAPPPLFLGVAALAGAACTGFAIHPAPIPVDWSLCGGRVCIQNFVVCLNALQRPGINMTNALELVFN